MGEQELQDDVMGRAIVALLLSLAFTMVLVVTFAGLSQAATVGAWRACVDRHPPAECGEPPWRHR